jgi:hypothetical protein
MKEIAIVWPAGMSDARLAARIEAACAAHGLTCALHGTLRAYPGCMHWHYKRGRQSGTLEITLWPRGRRAWFAVHTNRGAAWIDDAITAIGAALCASL